MEKRLLHKKKLLHRMTLAQTAFRQASRLCEHMEKMKIGTHDELASAMMAGIVVSYIRPFIRSDGIGPLPRKYSKFEKGSPYKRIHDTILEARHWVYAHRDNLNAPNLAGSKVSEEVVSEVILNLRKDGYSVSINEPQILVTQLRNFRSLFSFQNNRINEEVGDLIVSIMNEEGIGIGTYKICDEIRKIS